jgi:hypothetical protein
MEYLARRFNDFFRAKALRIIKSGNNEQYNITCLICDVCKGNIVRSIPLILWSENGDIKYVMHATCAIKKKMRLKFLTNLDKFKFRFKVQQKENKLRILIF